MAEHVQQIQSQGSEQLALLRFVGLSGHLGVVSQGPGGPDTAKWYFMKIMNRANHNPGTPFVPFLINIRTQLAVLLGPALPVDHLPNAMGQAVACANGVFGQEAQNLFNQFFTGPGETDLDACVLFFVSMMECKEVMFADLPAYYSIDQQQPTEMLQQVLMLLPDGFLERLNGAGHDLRATRQKYSRLKVLFMSSTPQGAAMRAWAAAPGMPLPECLSQANIGHLSQRLDHTYQGADHIVADPSRFNAWRLFEGQILHHHANGRRKHEVMVEYFEEGGLPALPVQGHTPGHVAQMLATILDEAIMPMRGHTPANFVEAVRQVIQQVPELLELPQALRQVRDQPLSYDEALADVLGPLTARLNGMAAEAQL